MINRVKQFISQYYDGSSIVLYVLEEGKCFIPILIIDPSISESRKDVRIVEDLVFETYCIPNFDSILNELNNNNLRIVWEFFFKNAVAYRDSENLYYVFYSWLIKTNLFDKQMNCVDKQWFETLGGLRSKLLYADQNSSLIIANTIIQSIQSHYYKLDASFCFFLWYQNEKSFFKIQGLFNGFSDLILNGNKQKLISELNQYLTNKGGDYDGKLNPKNQVNIFFESDLQNYQFFSRIYFPLFKKIRGICQSGNFYLQSCISSTLNKKGFCLSFYNYPTEFKKYLNDSIHEFTLQHYSHDMVRKIHIPEHIDYFDQIKDPQLSDLITCLQTDISHRILTDFGIQNIKLNSSYISVVFLELTSLLTKLGVLFFESKDEYRNFWNCFDVFLKKQYLNSNFSFLEEKAMNADKLFSEYELYCLSHESQMKSAFKQIISDWNVSIGHQDPIYSILQQIKEHTSCGKLEDDFIFGQYYFSNVNKDKIQSNYIIAACIIEKILNSYCIPFYYRPYISFIFKKKSLWNV